MYLAIIKGQTTLDSVSSQCPAEDKQRRQLQLASEVSAFDRLSSSLTHLGRVTQEWLGGHALIEVRDITILELWLAKQD